MRRRQTYREHDPSIGHILVFVLACAFASGLIDLPLIIWALHER
jgi:hypothetical protein